LLDQRFFYSCIDSLPYGIAIIQKDLIIYINPRMAELLGYCVEELTCCTSGKILDNVYFTNQNLLNNYPDINYLIHRDGTQVSCKITKTRLKESDEYVYIIREFTEAHLCKHLAHMHSVIEDSAQAIIVTGLDGTIINWNNAAADVYGYTAEDIIGRNISIIMPPDLRFSMLNRINRGEPVQKQRTLAWTKQGILVNIELSISPVKDDNQYIAGISFFSRDITLEKLAEKKIFYQSRLLEAVNDSIITANFDGAITYWNKVSERLFGWKSKEVLGKSCSMLFVEDDFNELFNYLQKVNSGQWEGVKQIRTIENEKKYVRMSINTIYDELQQPDFLVVVFTDISEIVASRLKAEEAFRSRSEFMANISHEIRTPTSGVLGYAELMDEDKLDKDQNKYLQGIKQNARQLLNLINDFLDLSKIEANSMLLDEVSFNINELLGSSIEIFEPSIKEKNLSLNVKLDGNIPERICGDQVKIRQVLNNLLSNAVKFTHSGKIEIIVNLVDSKYIQPELISLSFSVIDSGIGIPLDKTTDIFIPFTQADISTTRKYGGTGLGLAISKRLIELMNGTIYVESTPGKGSKFSFILPLRYENKDINNHDTNDKSSLTKKRVLVVSDNYELAANIKEILSGSDYLPVTIGYNKKFATAINFHQPCAIIIDMDKIDAGKEKIVEKIKNLLLVEIPLIIYSNTMCRQDVYKYAGNDLIRSPINSAELMKILDRQMNIREIEEYSLLQYSILLVDNNEINLKLLSEISKNAGYETHTSSYASKVINIISDVNIALLIIDLDLITMQNKDFIKKIYHVKPDIQILGLRRNEQQFDDGIQIYINKPYTTNAILSAINKCLTLYKSGRDNNA